MKIGDRIKEIRAKNGMSQVALADRIKVSKQTLYKYENGVITNIPADKIEAIANVFDVSPAYLMGWDDGFAERLAAYHDELKAQRVAELYKLASECDRKIIDLVLSKYEKGRY